MPKTPLAPQHASLRAGVCRSRLIQLEAQGQLTSMRDSAGRRTYDPDEIDAFRRKRELQREAQRRAREQRLHPNRPPPPAPDPLDRRPQPERDQGDPRPPAA